MSRKESLPEIGQHIRYTTLKRAGSVERVQCTGRVVCLWEMTARSFWTWSQKDTCIWVLGIRGSL